METKLEGDSRQECLPGLPWPGLQGMKVRKGVREGLRQRNPGTPHGPVWNLLLCVRHFTCLQIQTRATSDMSLEYVWPQLSCTKELERPGSEAGS